MGVEDLTPAELKTIAGRLLGTRQNVYVLVKSMFPIEKPGEDVFDLLAKHAAVGRCGNCDTWKTVPAELSDPDGGYCEACLDELNDADEDE